MSNAEIIKAAYIKTVTVDYPGHLGQIDIWTMTLLNNALEAKDKEIAGLYEMNLSQAKTIKRYQELCDQMGTELEERLPYFNGVRGYNEGANRMESNEMIETNNFGYVLIATGNYSDYCATLFKVLKQFNFAEAATLCKSQESPKYGWKDSISPDQFISWLNKNGYIEDCKEITEIHVGGYGRMEIEDSAMNIQFIPLEDKA